jgi:hypothetical protein
VIHLQRWWKLYPLHFVQGLRLNEGVKAEKKDHKVQRLNSPEYVARGDHEYHDLDQGFVSSSCHCTIPIRTIGNSFSWPVIKWPFNGITMNHPIKPCNSNCCRKISGMELTQIQLARPNHDPTVIIGRTYIFQAQWHFNITIPCCFNDSATISEAPEVEMLVSKQSCQKTETCLLLWTHPSL